MKHEYGLTIRSTIERHSDDKCMAGRNGDITSVLKYILVRYTEGCSGSDISKSFTNAKDAPTMRSLAGKDIRMV